MGAEEGALEHVQVDRLVLGERGREAEPKVDERLPVPQQVRVQVQVT